MTTLHTTITTTLEGDLREIAFRSLREWLCCSDFRSRAPIETALDRTWLGQAIHDLEAQVGWQWYKTEEGRHLHQLRKKVVDLWIENGWVRVESPRLGRRRVADYSSQTIKKAMSIWNNGCQGYVSDSTWKWAGSVLGENSNRNKLFVVTLTEQVFEKVYQQVDPENLDGWTREQLATVLDLPKRLANHFVRYLVETHGWSVRETTRQGVKCRVLRSCQTNS